MSQSELNFDPKTTPAFDEGIVTAVTGGPEHFEIEYLKGGQTHQRKVWFHPAFWIIKSAVPRIDDVVECDTGNTFRLRREIFASGFLGSRMWLYGETVPSTSLSAPGVRA